MTGRVRPGAPDRLPLGQWAPMSILGSDGCVYAIAAQDLTPEVRRTQVVRFDIAGTRAVNITPAVRPQ